MDVGEFWAHRARAHRPVARVEVLRLGTKRPPRVKIRFTADEEEGREAWVPRSQLHVLWDQADRWLAEERRWEELRAATPPRDAPERRAADIVFESCPWDELASVGLSALSNSPFVPGWNGALAQNASGRRIHHPVTRRRVKSALWLVRAECQPIAFSFTTAAGDTHFQLRSFGAEDAVHEVMDD